MSNDTFDRLYDEVTQDLRPMFPYIARLLRGVALATVAACLAAVQRHFDYSAAIVFFVVLPLSILNRYHFIAGLVIIWLATLYLVSPDVVSSIKALCR